MADTKTTRKTPVGRASARQTFARPRNALTKSLLALTTLGLIPAPASACKIPDMGVYFFLADQSGEAPQKEFSGKIRIISFEPTKWQSIEYQLSDGTARSGRKLLDFPTIEFEIIEVFRGDLIEQTSRQKLQADTCNAGLMLDPGDEHHVAGHIVDGQPILQKILYYSGD